MEPGQKIYGISFMFDQPEVLEAQQTAMTANGLDADGYPIPRWDGYLSKLITSKYWASVNQDHVHESDRILTKLRFISRPLDAAVTEEQLFEAAVMDMFGWLREVRLEHAVPVMVEMLPAANGKFEQHIDKTVEAIAFLGRLAALQGLTPDSFSE